MTVFIRQLPLQRIEVLSVFRRFLLPVRAHSPGAKAKRAPAFRSALLSFPRARSVVLLPLAAQIAARCPGIAGRRANILLQRRTGGR